MLKTSKQFTHGPTNHSIQVSDGYTISIHGLKMTLLWGPHAAGQKHLLGGHISDAAELNVWSVNMSSNSKGTKSATGSHTQNTTGSHKAGTADGIGPQPTIQHIAPTQSTQATRGQQLRREGAIADIAAQGKSDTKPPSL
ncbi:hypothetical protein MIND_01326700 [Mycena indigotica]|uniref:Uncharacterized protein n=1 Tax=Mycena indigotica TaxID=2126181 RepID=A0A8H6S019_9AGAR|nr:uncharacterized protein MIND_01326700 [Mycena indigotica]KAF7290855.1 hypothetical protein MIND_01326700 [Mycena indigotica]